MNKKVLVIDDEHDIVELLRYTLERAQFSVVGASEGKTGLHLAEQEHPDVIVLDWMMPGLTGLEVCRRLRVESPTARIPVIMLTAKGTESDRVAGLEVGADDYVTKPFSPKELVARIHAVLRRRAVVQTGDLTIDLDRQQVLYRGSKLSVTPAEFHALQLLAASPARILFHMPTRPQGLLLGEIAVREKLVTRTQLDAALTAQDRAPNRRIGQVLVERGYLRPDQVEWALARQRERFVPTLLGPVLISRSLATEFQVHEGLRLQGRLSELGIRPVPRLGEILVKRGALTAAALDAAIEIQSLKRLGCPGCGDSFDPVARTCGRCGREFPTLYARIATALHEALDAEARRHRIDIPEQVLAACANSENDLGKYLLLREVGRGGMGVVHRAWQKESNQVVALKVLSHKSLTGTGVVTPFGDADDVKRFHAEARAISQLDHPHIVRVLDYGTYRNHFYIAMPFIDGISLEAFIHDSRDEAIFQRTYPGLRSFRLFAAVIRDVALAVNEAHDKGIVHRDLKPGNVLIDLRGHPWVIDFGLARMVQGEGAHERSDVVVGTPYYMAPEQAGSGVESIDFLADVYSLGAMLYELAAGAPPYAGKAPEEALMTLTKEPPTPVETAAPGVPSELARIIGKAMAYEKRHRYPGAIFMAEDLGRYLSGLPLQGGPPGSS